MKTVIDFWVSERGAVTIDWVVLTAAIVGFGLVVLIPFGFSDDTYTHKIANDISERPVGYLNQVSN